MPIIERTAALCFRRFAEHVRALVADTLTRQHPMLLHESGERSVTLSFREGRPIAAPIVTPRFGRLFVYVCQLIEAVPDGKHFRLRTRRYWYRIQSAADLRTPALIRWEYNTDAPADGPPRNHVQLAASVPVGGAVLDFDKLHVPTGWATIEEVIRFIIVDLGARPPCGAKWPGVIAESERAFYEDFTGKRHKPAK